MGIVRYRAEQSQARNYSRPDTPHTAGPWRFPPIGEPEPTVCYSIHGGRGATAWGLTRKVSLRIPPTGAGEPPSPTCGLRPPGRAGKAKATGGPGCAASPASGQTPLQPTVTCSAGRSGQRLLKRPLDIKAPNPNSWEQKQLPPEPAGITAERCPVGPRPHCRETLRVNLIAPPPLRGAPGTTALLIGCGRREAGRRQKLSHSDRRRVG